MSSRVESIGRSRHDELQVPIKTVDHGVTSMEYEGHDFEHEVDDDAFRAALELNRQLKAAMAHGGGDSKAATRARSQQPTASGAPRHSVGDGRRSGRAKTFSDGRVREIGRDNLILLEKMARIADRPRQQSEYAARAAPDGRLASTTLNRARTNDKIAKENMLIAQRLAKVKPSRGLARTDMSRHSTQHARLADQIRDPHVRAQRPRHGDRALAPEPAAASSRGTYPLAERRQVSSGGVGPYRAPVAKGSRGASSKRAFLDNDGRPAFEYIA